LTTTENIRICHSECWAANVNIFSKYIYSLHNFWLKLCFKLNLEYAKM